MLWSVTRDNCIATGSLAMALALCKIHTHFFKRGLGTQYSQHVANCYSLNDVVSNFGAHTPI